MDDRPLLVTERLDLWKPRAGDLADLHAMMDDAETVRFVGNQIPDEADDFARLVRNAGSWALYGYGTFMVRPRGEQQLIGVCGVFHSHRGFGAQHGFDDAPEAGWIIHRDHWGQGFAGEAMRAAIGWFDREHGPQRIGCMIEVGNVPSARLAASLGFTECGRRIEDDGAELVLYRRG